MNYLNFYKLITIVIASFITNIPNLSGNICKKTEPTSTRFIYEETICGKTKRYERFIEKLDQVPCSTVVSIEDYAGQKITITGNKLSITEERKGPESIGKIRITRNTQGLIEVSLMGDSNNKSNRILYICGRRVKIHILPPHELKHLRCSTNSGFLEQTEINTFTVKDTVYQTKVTIQRKESFSQTRTCPIIEIYGIDLHTWEKNDQLPPTTIVAQINKDTDMLEVNVLGNRDKHILTISDHNPAYLQLQQLSTPIPSNTFTDWIAQLAHRAASFIPGL